MGLEEAIAIIRKTYGESAIRKLSEIPRVNVASIDTGSYAINHALGCGGWPKRHMIELFGPEASGKTTLCYHAIASVQRDNGKAAFIDVEHRVDLDYAKAIGVNANELFISQPSSGEEACTIVKELLSNKAIDLCIVDSIAALTPQVMIDGDYTDANISAQARLLGKALREFSQLKTTSNCCLIFTNQIREKPGVIYGNPEYEPGGRSPKFYCSVRAKLKKRTEKDNEGNESHNECTIKFVKNSCGIPFKEAEFSIKFGEGIDKIKDTFEEAVRVNIIQKKGSYYQIQDKSGEWKNFAQGQKQGESWIKENLEKIRQRINKKQEDGKVDEAV